ncbi:MAG: ParM/StbA family protein [Cyanobacteria bacterium P01_G01_bin.49]
MKKTNRKKTLNSVLNVSIDLGGSKTKIIGGTSFTKRVVLTMEPSIAEMPRSILENVMGLENANVEDKVWVEVEGKIYGVGYLAKVLTVSNPQLTALKSTIALPKILGVLWVLKQKLNLADDVSINLSCLLPPGEIKDREKLEAQLKQVFSRGFETPTGKLTPKLNYYSCLAEGSGIYMLHRAKKGKELVNATIVAVVMLGYRNASVMVFRRGIIHEYQTNSLGFVHLIKSMVKQLSGQTIERLTPAIAQYRKTGSEVPLHSVLLSEDQPVELEQVKLAEQVAEEGYEYELKNWLEEVLPRDIEEVILCGGTSDDPLIKTKLLDYFGDKRVYFHAQVDLPSDVKALELGNRFGDVWCVWDYLNLQLSKQKRRKVA